LWAFGDGNTSTAVNPTHTYAAPGTYDVVLTATNACGTSTKASTITIESSGAPVAAFVANPSSGCAPLTVNFTNNSVSAVSYQWQFPGGNPDNSTDVSPTVIYENPGDYTATLIATNANGSDTASVVVSVLTVPTAEFIYLVQNDTTYYFTNNSTGATAYHWDFGDGNTSTDENPVHHYPALDSVVTYTVVLTAENDCGTATYTQNVAVVTRPVAGFTATPNTGCAPLTVQFTNTSTPNASTFHWLFPGGTPDTSVVSNPTVVYETPGTYSVTLIVSNSAGRDTSVRTDYIVVNTVPTASFTSAANGLLVAFTNTSTGATEYSWDFGDNSGSIEASPIHEYAADGDYTVILTATNSCGTVTSTQSVSVATAPTAGFTASANAGCAPLTVQFTNTSSSNATAFDWDFPGGLPSGSNAQTPPAVLYEVPGTYTVTLTVSNAAGTSSFTQVVVVSGGPTANFSSTVSGLDVQFTSSSSNATAYSWDFGDNQGSNAPNPSHTYAADGTYTVVLTVSNDCGTSTFTQNVVITTAPEAGFSASTTSGCAVLSVTFTDISDGAPVSWEWSFPGGVPSTSNVQSPTVQYFIPGVYDVTLVVTSAGGSTSSFTQSNFITVFGPPTANFSSSASGNTVSFTNGSVDATSYIWNFGDQSTSTSENPTHTYAEDGVYTVTLTATNNCGSSIYEQTVTVATPPTASFTQDGNSGCAPLTVQFASTSSANATSLAWDFPGGTPAFSFEANPVVTWNTAGTYVVTLTASNSAGSSTSTVTINVNDVPNVGFMHSVAGPNATFANTSSNATSYVWNFGDGSDVSNEANPTHTYAQAGTYTVTLTAENECGTATFTQTVEIVGSAPTPAISANSVEGCAPFTVNFSDQSSGSPDSWVWSFPGGSPATSTEQNPQVTYNLPGVYDVTLEVSNAFGGGSTTFPAYVTVLGPPTANFVASSNQTTVAFANTSQGATSYEWNFGDGSPISTEADPTHTYAAPGTYTVTLVATNSCGSAIIEVTLTLTSGTGEVAWVDVFRLFPNPNTGAFMVEMSGLPQKEVDFVLFNALGQFVKRETLDFGAGVLRHQFDYGDLAAGFYTLRVQGSNGQAIHLKVTVGR
jgi:PKD repeat protein